MVGVTVSVSVDVMVGVTVGVTMGVTVGVIALCRTGSGWHWAGASSSSYPPSSWP